MSKALFICGLIISLLLPSIVLAQANDVAAKTEAIGPVVEMEPYVVKGERILPDPESWLYIKVPALELTRGKQVLIVPGYEVLSSIRGKKNTLLFVDELQLLQLGYAILFPNVAKSLPRATIPVVMDDDKMGLSGSIDATLRAWEGDSAFTTSAMTEADRPVDARYSFGTQTRAYTFGVREMAPDFENDFDRGEPEFNNEPAPEIFQSSEPEYTRDQELDQAATAVSVAMNGGPLTVYIKDSAENNLRSTPIPEEKLAQALWLKLNKYVLNSTTKNAPEWMQEGMTRLYSTVTITRKQIDYGQATFHMQTQPKLADVLGGQKKLATIEHGDRYAAAFVHYGLYGDNGAYASKFLQFVTRLETEPFSPQLFKECFGKSISTIETYLSTYIRSSAAYKSTRMKGSLPDMPKVTARDATQSEVARLKAEIYVAQGLPVKALDELRIAYWRSERDPEMLSMLAFLEEHIGSIPRAQKIVKTLLEQPRPSARTYLIAAKLRFRELTDGKDKAGTLNVAEENSVMDFLSKARERGLLNEDLCTMLARLVLRSAAAPDAGISGFLAQAAKRYPLNRIIVSAAALPPASA